MSRRYHLFAGNADHPTGGMGDYIGSYSEIVTNIRRILGPTART
jgi:hypothetical protein